MINLHESMGPVRDWTHDPWICSQTPICFRTPYRLRYAARWEWHVIYILKEVGAREAQADMEETDGTRLPRVEFPDCWAFWRSDVRSAMHAASQFTWKGAHWCGWCPCTCMLIKNPIMIMMRIIETVLLRTHNICFGWKTIKLIFNYALWSGGWQYLFNP